jgi:hypothetical protein
VKLQIFSPGSRQVRDSLEVILETEIGSHSTSTQRTNKKDRPSHISIGMKRDSVTCIVKSKYSISEAQH